MLNSFYRAISQKVVESLLGLSQNKLLVVVVVVVVAENFPLPIGKLLQCVDDWQQENAQYIGDMKNSPLQTSLSLSVVAKACTIQLSTRRRGDSFWAYISKTNNERDKSSYVINETNCRNFKQRLSTP